MSSTVHPNYWDGGLSGVVHTRPCNVRECGKAAEAIEGTNAQSEQSSMSHNGSRPPSDELNQHGKRMQELIAKIDVLPDPNARELLQECMQEVLAFYGIGLDRVLEVRGVPPADRTLMKSWSTIASCVACC